MNFKDNKAIYLQIADRIGDQILAGHLTPDGKVPSVRELAAEIEVNANTVARTYDHLQQNGASSAPTLKTRSSPHAATS